jgi:hypothetical protein
MDMKWKIHRKSDGTFDIFMNGELLHPSIPQNWLERQLAPYGIIGDTFSAVLEQLSETGKAAVELHPPGKSSQTIASMNFSPLRPTE